MTFGCQKLKKVPNRCKSSGTVAVNRVFGFQKHGKYIKVSEKMLKNVNVGIK